MNDKNPPDFSFFSSLLESSPESSFFLRLNKERLDFLDSPSLDSSSDSSTDSISETSSSESSKTSSVDPSSDSPSESSSISSGISKSSESS